MRARRFEPEDAEHWDAFCSEALNATFLHTRRFLSYHGDRFADVSLILEDDKGRWLGLLAAAQDPDDAATVVSHPGITYGGVLHAGRLTGGRMLAAFETICAHYRDHGFGRLIYKAVPDIYHGAAAEDDLYALFRRGAHRYRCDLSTAIRLDHRLRKSERRRRAARKAERAGITLGRGAQHLESLWRVLRDNLSLRHDAAPVHSEAEIRDLAGRFPDNIRFVHGWLEDELVAGMVLFITANVHHAQYITSSERGQEVNALDAVFENCIATAAAEGARWFDFGISNEEQGHYLNDGLYTFKSEFGGGGIVHEFYQIELNDGVE